MTDEAEDLPHVVVAVRRGWTSYVGHGWSRYFDGSASPQFVGSIVLAIGIGILIGILPSGGSSKPASTVLPAAVQAEEKAILHIEELSAKSQALEASKTHRAG